MEKKYEFVCQNDNVSLEYEIKEHVSKKFYKRMRFYSKTYVNGIELSKRELIKKGDIITIYLEEESNETWEAYESKLDIYYEDDNYLVVYKKEDLLSIPIKACPKSLYQELLYYFKLTNQNVIPSILNRLDRETEGLVVVAKNRIAAYKLSPTHEHIIRKYVCLCEGLYENDFGTIKTYIAKDENSNKRYISDTGKIAISDYRVLKRFDNKTLVEYVLKTGRTHQIRLHSSYINHPIIGDYMYGSASKGDKLYLKSYYVEFFNSFSNKLVKCEIGSDFDWKS